MLFLKTILAERTLQLWAFITNSLPLWSFTPMTFTIDKLSQKKKQKQRINCEPWKQIGSPSS